MKEAPERLASSLVVPHKGLLIRIKQASVVRSRLRPYPEGQVVRYCESGLMTPVHWLGMSLGRLTGIEAALSEAAKGQCLTQV